VIVASHHGDAEGIHRTRGLIASSAAIVDHVSFSEMLIGAAALRILAAGNPKIQDYWTAECLTRQAAARLLPKLANHQLADCSSDMAEVQPS
jgi:hypothetical protein